MPSGFWASGVCGLESLVIERDSVEREGGREREGRGEGERGEEGGSGKGDKCTLL